MSRKDSGNETPKKTTKPTDEYCFSTVRRTPVSTTSDTESLYSEGGSHSSPLGSPRKGYKELPPLILTEGSGLSDEEILKHFSLLDTWLENPEESELIYKFLLPVVEVANGAGPDEITQNVGEYVQSIFGKMPRIPRLLSELEKYKPFFHAICRLLSQTIREKGALTHLCHEVSRTVISDTAEEMLHQMDPSFRFHVKNTLLIPIANRLNNYLFMLYEAAYGQEALEQFLDEVTAPDRTTETSTLGIIGALTPLTVEWSKEALEEKFESAIRKVTESPAWKERNFMHELLRFLETEDDVCLANFINRISYILFTFQEVSKDALGGDDIPRILEAAIELGLRIYSGQLTISVLSALYVTLGSIAERLEPEIYEEAEIVHEVVGLTKQKGEKEFKKNRLRLSPELDEALEDQLFELTIMYYRRIYDFVRLLSEKVLKERSYKMKMKEKIENGLKKTGAIYRFRSDASLLFVNFMMTMTERKGKAWKEVYIASDDESVDSDRELAQETKRPLSTLQPIDPTQVSNPPSIIDQIKAGWKVFKEKWKALPIGWKILAGIGIILGLAAVIVGAILFPPSALVTLPSTVIPFALVGGGGGVVVVTVVGHASHVAATPVSKETAEQGRPDAKIAVLAFGAAPMIEVPSFGAVAEDKANTKKDVVIVEMFSLFAERNITVMPFGANQNKGTLLSVPAFGQEKETKETLVSVPVFGSKEVKRSRTATSKPALVRRGLTSQADIFGERQRKEEIMRDAMEDPRPRSYNEKLSF